MATDVEDRWDTEVRELAEELARLTGRPGRPPSPADVTAAGRDLLMQLGLFRSTVARRDRVLDERRWREAEIEGYEQALRLLGGEPDADQVLRDRLVRKIETRRADLVGLDEDIALLQWRVEHLTVHVAELRARVVEELRRLVERAATAEERAAAQRRAMRLHRKMGTVQPDVMWSPVPVDGYRIWTIGDDGLYGARSRWEVPTSTATCELGDDVPHTDGRCARVAFGCGIYAAKSPARLMSELCVRPTSTFVIGRVDLEGTVIEHERGYRAARATVRALVVVDRGAVRFTDDPDAIGRVFADPAEAPLVAPLVRTSTEERFDRMIERRLQPPAGRYERWISGDNDG